MRLRNIDKKGFIKNYLSGFLRAALTALLVIFQFALIFILSYLLSSYGLLVYAAIELVSMLAIVGLVNKNSNYSFKIAWMVIISLIPVAGLLMYLLWGRDTRTRKIKIQNLSHIIYGYQFNKYDSDAFEEYSKSFPENVRMAKYMEAENFPLYKNNEFVYYPTGEEAFDSIIDDLKGAENFIFISFFIVADGALWEKIKSILLDKVNKGVEIRFLYDDFGSMFRTDKLFWRELENAGIKLAKFNPIHKYMDKLYMNFRTHQKLIIIDGKCGYTGGINLADEYVNAVQRFGVWKDNAVKITGDGVFGFTSIFLQMWGIATKKDEENYNKYKLENGFNGINNSFCQIIYDGPDNNPGNPIAAVYKQLIANAKDYLYITTPYLVLEDDIKDLLIEAAESGVDVRIFTPAIPDKKTVYLLTQYNYGKVLEKGVKIFEYTPGFIHAKTIITKDFGIVGTINCDYRSMYLHYECGAFLWDKDIVQNIKKDILDTEKLCRQITFDEWYSRPLRQKFIQRILELFSCLM